MLPWQPKTRLIQELSNRLLACRLTCALVSCLERGFSLRCFPDVVAGCWAAVPRSGGRPGPGLPGFGAPAGWAGFRADVPKPPADAGRGKPARRGGPFPGRRRSAASGRARRSWVWAVMISQVHRSAAAGSRILGAVHPGTCLNSLKVCSRSKRRKNACHRLSASSGVAPVPGAPQP